MFHLNIDVDLRAWIEGSQHCRFKCLFEVTGNFKRTSITPWPTLPLCCAEYCHAELTVYKDLVLQCKTPGSTHLITIIAHFLQNTDHIN